MKSKVYLHDDDKNQAIANTIKSIPTPSFKTDMTNTHENNAKNIINECDSKGRQNSKIGSSILNKKSRKILNDISFGDTTECNNIIVLKK